MSALPCERGEPFVGKHPDAELLHVEHIIRNLGKANEVLVIDASLSLIRKFYQAWLDGLTTNEGVLLLEPWRTRASKRSPEAQCYRIVLINQGVQLGIFYTSPVWHNCHLELRLEDGSYATAPGDSRFAWLLFVTGIQSSCTCTCCLMETIARHSELILELKSSIRRLSFRSNLYHCDTGGCSHTSKRWADLLRHVSTSHCSKPATYPCSYPGCERGGGNGFPRKDKMKSHFENVHRGRGIPPRQPRTLAPKRNSSKLSKMV